ncbi:unnamed protein product [Effrenium voratum]|uniref:Anoctamin transmembrane domain-containing protein n=1 Tax=Effrenium voratum TaxID=2562239 RepID=A0AA36I4B8_9DINO|nr:unnamed protein product [Effrenium voratum]
MEPMPVPEWEDPEVRAEVPAREPDAAREEPVPAAPREERLSTAMPSLAPREELKGALTKTADSALPGEHSDAEPQEPAELQPQEPQEPQEFQEPEAVAEARASPGKADARGRSGKGKAKSKPGHRQKSVDAARGTQSAMAAEEPVLVPPAPGVRFSPSVIGKHEVLLDVDEKAGEFPQYHRMPPSLPFHFRLDVSALKFSANGLAKAKWLQKLREELEKNWRYSRKDQERAWVREGELPGEVRDILERNGKCSEQVMAAVQRRRADPSWQEENDQGQMEKTMPMHVLRLERLARRGEELTQEDAKEITEEGLWCNMIYDLSTDPLLQDIGYAGQNPTQFSAMVLIYTRHLDKLDLKKDLTQELRVAHVDHFEYGLCFPIRPYPSCQLPPPPDREDLSWIFEREGRTADGAELERLVKQGDAMMTTLFWQCFDAFFHADYKRQSTTKPAFSRTQLFAKPTAKDLTACGTRQEALLALLSILRAQAFQFPFCQKVTFVEAVEHRKSQKSFPGAGHCDVLAAAEVAVQRALREYTAAMQDGNQEMPQWAERPIRLRERDFATAATPPGNSEDIGGAGAVTTMSRVRPEFALQWRKNFDNASQDDQQQTYHMLRGLLKIPHADDPHFDDRALKTDIMHFDEACYLSDWLQIWRSLVSYLASGVFILFATTATFGALAARQALGLEGTTAGYAVTGLTSSVLVPLLNVVHYQVVIYTNNYQLFRDDSAKEKDFFDRLFIFNLFNTYNSLLWIVFAERNMAQLRVQVLFLCLSSIFMNNFIEFYWSLWMKQLKKMKSNSLPVASNMWTTLRYLLTGELHDDGVPEPMDPVSTALEHVSEELSRDLPFEVVDEAIELVIQYGVIMMFTVAFPMAPLLAFINVHIEKRLDSLKIVKLMQFPEPRMVVGMGRPFAAFVIVTGLGLLVSGLTLYFAAYEGRDCERCDTWGSCSGCAGTSVQLLLPEATTELRLFLLGGGGTVMLLVMYICFSSPPLSIKIVHEQYRQKMYENRLRFRRETGDAHGRLSRRVSVKGPASPQGMPE